MKKRNLSVLLLLSTLPAFTHAQNAWTHSFDIVIFNRPIPSVSPNSVSISPAPLDDVVSTKIYLSNTGNKASSFTISGLPPAGLVPIWATQNGWANIPENSNDKDGSVPPIPNPLPIGFTFPYYGNTFDTVRVLKDKGTIQLGGTSANELAVFRPNPEIMTISGENIRYLREENRFTVSWVGANIAASTDLENGLNNIEFQVQLYKNGEIRYLYMNMDGAQAGDGEVGYRGDGSSFVDVSFGADNEGVNSFENSMVILNQQSWFSTSAEANPVKPVSTNALDLLVDNTFLKAINLNGKIFNLNVNWDDGSSDVVAVTVVRQAANYQIDVSPSPLNLPVTAPLGTVTVKNSGNTPLNFSLLAPAAKTANNYSWSPSSALLDQTAGPQFIPTEDPEEGQSPMLPLAFPFPFFGKYYTNISISVNGYILLGTDTLTDTAPIIAPYMQDLTYNPSISKINTVGGAAGLYVVTWRDMSGDDGFRQTFQVILEEDGTITFQYEQLDGTNTWISSDIGGTIKYLQTPVLNRPKPSLHAIGLNYDNIEVEKTLIWSVGSDFDLGTVTTNEVITQTHTPVGDNEFGDMVLVTNTVVVYDDPLVNQAFTFTPSDANAPFSFSPVLGSLLPGETQNITVDARGQAVGTSKNYQILSQDPTPPSFTVTVKAAGSAPLLDRDFDGQSDSAELLAGTNPLDAGSSFSISSVSSVNADGSRTIPWTAPTTELVKGRNYTIWYTTNLLDGWQILKTVKDQTSFTDTEHSNASVIYYKVTID